MRKTLSIDSREQAIEEIKQRLLSSSNPRFEMFFILSLTGLFGFFASFWMLNLGMTEMSLRYPIAVLFAYCMFLLFLRLWLSYKRDEGIEPDLDIDLPDIDLTPPHSHAASGTFHFSGSSSGSSPKGGGGGFSLDLDDGWLIVLACAALAGALIVCLYVIYSAPVFLAEILLDSLLLAGLYKRLKNVEGRHWVLSAISRSWIPILLVVVFFAIAGYLMQMAAPDAHSMGEVWAHFKADQKS